MEHNLRGAFARDGQRHYGTEQAGEAEATAGAQNVRGVRCSLDGLEPARPRLQRLRKRPRPARPHIVINEAERMQRAGLAPERFRKRPRPILPHIVVLEVERVQRACLAPERLRQRPRPVVTHIVVIEIERVQRAGLAPERFRQRPRPFGTHNFARTELERVLVQALMPRRHGDGDCDAWCAADAICEPPPPRRVSFVPSLGQVPPLLIAALLAFGSGVAEKPKRSVLPEALPDLVIHNSRYTVGVSRPAGLRAVASRA